MMEKELNYLSEKIAEGEKRKEANESWLDNLVYEPYKSRCKAKIKLLDEEIELLQSILSAVTYFELGGEF
jgi:hypothetical protein